ncbi:MAG: LAGLIDADG family homing endonuclease [Candidatus Nanoarchaeia archaeon]|nr:LAGLIDADG family homing endonuclease [Candidatus Nanoarchaeia archaeon]MDD5239334.1 LAGLIDADG family homing endonuclease [Candidatus Nanoarchaeia archaeon]
MAKIDISKERLVQLYIDQNLPSTKICKLFGCCKATILKRLKENKIHLRAPGHKRVDVSKTELQEFYLKKKMSSRKISKVFGCHYSTIDRKLKKYEFNLRDRADSHIIYPRRKFSGDLLEHAYLLGFTIGDLRTKTGGSCSKTIYVACGSTQESQLELFKNLFQKYGRIWSKRCKGKINMEAYLDLSFSFLLNKKAGNWIFENNKTFYSFLAGFSDAEGSVFVSNGKARYSLGNYDSPLLNKIKIKLEQLGFICTKLQCDNLRGYVGKDGYCRNHDYWHFCINRKQHLLSLFECLAPYIKHPQKIKDIKRAKNNIITRNKIYFANKR